MEHDNKGVSSRSWWIFSLVIFGFCALAYWYNKGITGLVDLSYVLVSELALGVFGVIAGLLLVPRSKWRKIKELTTSMKEIRG